MRRLLSGHKTPTSLGSPLLQASSWLMSVSTCEELKEMIYTPPCIEAGCLWALGCGIPRLGGGGSLKKHLDHGARDQGWVRGWVIEIELGAEGQKEVYWYPTPSPAFPFAGFFFPVRESQGSHLPFREGSCLLTANIWGMVQFIMPPRISKQFRH